MNSDPEFNPRVGCVVQLAQVAGYELTRIGLEAGPLSQWLFAAMREAGLAVELPETRHVRKAFEAMPVKSDRNDHAGLRS